MRFLSLTTYLTALLAIAAAGDALAQEASPSELAAARDLFNQGIEAARAERWEEARGLFERSYRVAPRASTLLNLASAEAETGQLVRAAESYRRFVAEAGPREQRLVGSAEEALAGVEARLARVTLAAEGLEGDDEVWLDEQVIRHASMGIPLPVNPGDHVVTIARGGAPVGEARFSVGEGESTQVTVRAEASAEPAAVAVEPLISASPEIDDGDEGGTIWGSPWLWAGVGLVVALAVVIPLVIVAGGSTTSTHMGTLGVGTLAFE